MNPAANAPSTESSWNAPASTSSATSSSTVSRTVVCPVVSEPALISCITRVVPCRSRVHGSVITTASTANAASTTIEIPGRRALSRTAIATTGPSSPNAPWFNTAPPNGLPSIPASLRIGSSVPSAVEVRAMATATSAWTAPDSPTSQTATNASARQISQVVSARRPPRPVSSLSSSS